MYLGRVTGRLVATQRHPSTGVLPLQILQPLDEYGKPEGEQLVAVSVISTGPGDLVQYIDGREAALTCPDTFTPIDAAIIGFVEQAVAHGQLIGD